MDIKLFAEMLHDKHFNDLKKMKYKYDKSFIEFLTYLQELYYTEIPLSDFYGEKIVFTNNHSAISLTGLRYLFREQSEKYGLKNTEEEIIATCAIENIDVSRESVRNILKGFAVSDEQEYRIMGIKKGFDFISDIKNRITEENFYKLYMMAVGDFLPEEERLEEGSFYRHDTVYIVSDKVEHQGIDHKKLSGYMKNLFDFINTEDDINDLIKACIIHFYVAFIHPYFDGNGRMARLMHLWFLVQKGYRSVLFVPFSSEIEKSRKQYYNAFTLIEENRALSGKTDVTPMISYFINNVYNKIGDNTVSTDTFSVYEDMLKDGNITEKEKKLWQFVLSYYGTEEFSTKMLERDFADAAYATIRGFVLKFEKYGLLTSQKFGNRVKYRIT